MCYRIRIDLRITDIGKRLILRNRKLGYDVENLEDQNSPKSFNQKGADLLIIIYGNYSVFLYKKKNTRKK